MRLAVIYFWQSAAVCILSEWLSDDLLLSIASENNLSETAFLNLSTDPIGIRWFSPKREVDLCGHATLASARVLIDQSKFKDSEEIVFESKRGLLKAQKEGDLIFLDFPSDKPQVIENVFSNNLFDYAPQRVIKGTDDYYLFLIKRRRSGQSMPITKRSESSGFKRSDCQCYRLRREYCFPVFLSEIWN